MSAPSENPNKRKWTCTVTESSGKRARVDDAAAAATVPLGLALGPSPFASALEACPDLVIPFTRISVRSARDQERVLWPWRQVSKAARLSVEHVVREILQPRYRALEASLAAWKDAPLATPFPFPEPRGPLPMTWMHMLAFDDRSVARPPGALVDETKWFRPLFIWAVSYVLFPVSPTRAPVDIQRAIADARKPVFEPAYDYFAKSSIFELPLMRHRYHRRWRHAPAHSPHALLSTFSTGSYNHSLNMAEPGNHQHFTGALLDQMGGPRDAIAFLLFWIQHTTFETTVVDSTFLGALQDLVVICVMTWRCQWNKLCDIYGVDRDVFYLWFVDRPETLTYNPKFLQTGWSLDRAVREHDYRAAKAVEWLEENNLF